MSKMMGQSYGNMGYAPCFISYLLYKIGGGVLSIPAIKANNEIADTFEVKSDRSSPTWFDVGSTQ